MLINKKDKPTILTGFESLGASVPGGRMGKKVERDILSALGSAAGAASVTALQTSLTALTTAVSNISSSIEIGGWFNASMSNARGSAGIAMGRYTGAGSDLQSQWQAPHNGTIDKISGMLGTKVTSDAIKFGLTRNGVDFYGSVAATISSGQSCASILPTNLPFYAGDVISMSFGGGDSLAPVSATPFAASFEVKFS